MWKKALLTVIFLLFLYTRFAGLPWGLPYPMHPDERNMADSVVRLKCPDIADLKTCFNPQFFAYGQVPLYLAYAGVVFAHGITGVSGDITFQEATLALRVISALASLATAYILFRLTGQLTHQVIKKHRLQQCAPWLAVIAFLFSPYGIQFAHFGTTESALMLLYTVIVSLSLKLEEHPADRKNNLRLAVALGLAIAIKISSFIFMGVPLVILGYIFLRQPARWRSAVRGGTFIAVATAIVAAILSPQTIISWDGFLSVFSYESSVGTGTYQAFYTRQFIGTAPILFQFQKIFPYTLGLIAFILSLAGLAALPWKNRKLAILRLGFILYFLPTAFLFAKWSRFMAPVFPLMTVCAALFIVYIMDRFPSRIIRLVMLAVIAVSLLPGIAYLSIYTTQDVRFIASEWIYTRIPAGSKILAEAGNVINIPAPPPGYPQTPPDYQYVAFDFYHLDEDPQIQQALPELVRQADYILVPSRRIFMNHSGDKFPQVASYYHDLFSGRLGFTREKKFTAYPKISFFGHTLIEFPDEEAEETWTVFDHPVIRIYKRTGTQTSTPDFSGYKNTTFTVEGKTYRLLVAQNENEWEQGLMWVRSKEDADGYDGMIFEFPGKEIQTFWNKNTVTDLDLYWVDGQKVVGRAALPSIEKSKVIVTVSSPVAADKVVELIR